MSLLISRDSCDLAFDAVPDKPREIDTIKDLDINEGTDTVKEEEASITKPTTETTLESNPVPDSESESHSSERKDSSSNVINSSRAKPKKSGTGKKTTSKSTCSQHQGATVFNISKSTGVHIGNNLVIQCNDPNTIPKPGSNVPKATKEIKKLQQSTEAISIEHIDAVSSHVGMNWMEVGRQLNYTDGQLEQFYEDNGRKGLKEVVYQMLLDWKRANASKATVGMLCKALWISKQQDALEILAKPEKLST